MSQARVVTRLALRELWISFRMLLLLVGFVGAATAVALVPGSAAMTLTRLAVGLGIACLLATAITGWSFAEERVRGRAGWLVARSVRRGTVLWAWLTALASVALVGLLAAGGLGWLSLAAGVAGPDVFAYVTAMASVGGALLFALSVGLLFGCLLPARPAALIAALVCALVGIAAWLLPVATPYLPGGALAILARGSLSVAEAMRTLGIGLVGTAVLLGAARLALERAEL